MTILSIPKIDLHCHLDGSVRPSTVFELAQSERIELAIHSIDEILPLLQVPDNCPSLVSYLDRFQLPLAVMQKKEHLSRIAFEFMEDCHADGLSYIEVRFAPILHTQNGLRFEDAIESVLEGLKAGESSTGIPFGLIVCCMRHMTPAETLEHVEKTAPYRNRGVVAIDLAGDEANFPPSLHRKTFERALKSDFNITIHAGETGSWENIRYAVENLGAARIGHGLAAQKNPELIDFLIDRQIPLEMCPTSNLQTKGILRFEEHPILNYLHQGLAVTLNTDNRTVSNVTITSEQKRIQTVLSASDADLIQLASNSIRAAFTTDDTRQALLRKLYDATSL